jgi:Ser/Thr protein kinase RdoA (MazF antagonist)
MIHQLLAAYNLDNPESEVEAIHRGLINQTWRIKNPRGEFILQRINDSIFKYPASIASNLRMLEEYLSKKDPAYLFIAPIKTTNDEEMAFIDEGYFRLYPYVKDSHTHDAVQKPGQAYEAANAFGTFTRLLADFPVDKLRITLPDFHNLSLRYQQFSEALKYGNRARLQQSQELINFIEQNRMIVETYEDILRNPAFKLRVTHHDTKINNVLFDKDDKALCVIDLDTVMPGYFISDVGDMIRTYVSPVSEEEKDFSKIEVREDYLGAIWKGYMNEMDGELTADEKKHFIYAGKFMIYMQAIRFLADHLNNDVYYGARYEDHNFVRAGNQVVLLQRLLDKEPAIVEQLEMPA